MSHRPKYGLVSRFLLTFSVIAVMVGGVWNGSFAEELTSGTSSRQAKQQALQSIPFQQLNQQTQIKIRDVLQKPSIYRRLPVTMIDIDPDYFVFLARHPEVVVNIWKIMGVTRMTTTRTGPFTVSTNDGVGTVSNVELVYGTNNQHIFYGEGTYEGPVLKRKLRGECVMVLNTNYQKSATGKPTATSQLDVFLKVENATAGLIAKTLTPIVGTTADHNFVESLNFLQRLNETTVKNGVGVQRMANRLTDINNETRQKFVGVVGLVSNRSGGKPYSRNATPARSSYEIPAYPPSSYPSQSSSQPLNTAPVTVSFGRGEYNYGQPNGTQNYGAAQAGYMAQPQQPAYSFPPGENNASQGHQQSYPVNGIYYQQPQKVNRSNNRAMPGFSNNRIRTIQAVPTYQAPVYPAQNYYQR